MTVDSASMRPARELREASHHKRVVMLVLGLAAANLLRDRRFQGAVIAAGIGLAAVAAMGRENQAASLKRLMEWDKKRAAAVAGTLKAKLSEADS